MYLNKAIIIGNLVRDPELKSLPSGIKVCTFSVATNRTWKDKSGVRQDATDYHNVVVFGNQAATTAQYMKKGSSILVEGRMQTRSWDGKDGEKKYRTEVIADRIQFGPRKEGGTPGAAYPEKDTKGAPAPTADAPAIEYPEEEINPEDIPF
ncbi:MAG: single-stranded DNA-binding protein [Candidatus Paceibacterota bacterium]|jgi:single-strand DNA-binding protein